MIKIGSFILIKYLNRLLNSRIIKSYRDEITHVWEAGKPDKDSNEV